MVVRVQSEAPLVGLANDPLELIAPGKFDAKPRGELAVMKIVQRVILAVAVMSIVFTAPLGAVAIKLVGERALEPASGDTDAAFDALEESR